MSQQNLLSFTLDPIYNWFSIQKSSIHGMGLFSRREIPEGLFLGIAMIKKSSPNNYQEHLIDGYGNSSEDEWLRVIGARFINHSKLANIILKYDEDHVIAYAAKHIEAGEEIFADYAEIYKQISLPIPDFAA